MPIHFNAISREEFIVRARAKHGSRYDYSQCNYVRSKDRVIIICRQHGEFSQIPNNHLTGNGCPKCGAVDSGKAFVIGREGYLKLFSDAHGGKYSYEALPDDFKGREKISIKCPLHGWFKKSASEHAHGVGCPKCGAKRRSANSCGWTRTKWASKQMNRLAKLYLVRLEAPDESFYKIGITYRTPKYRLRLIPYNVFPVFIYASQDPALIYNLERRVKQQFKAHRYKPKIPFDGQTECFSEIAAILDWLNYFWANRLKT